MASEVLEAHLARNRGFERPAYPATIPALLRRAAERYGDAPACTFFEDDETLSFRQLDALSGRLANGFADLGVGHGDHVGVMLPNRMEYPLTWMALAKIGAVMVPINPRYTRHELDFALADSDAGFLVIDEAHLPLLAALGDRPAALEDTRVVVRGRAVPAGGRTWAALLEGGAEAFTPAALIAGGDPTTILYTSGTTGLPKGCIHSQDYWLVMSRQIPAATEAPVSRLLVQNLFHYMNCQHLMVSALNIGAALYVARQPSGSGFIPWLKRLGIEFCIFPEFVLKQQPEAADDAATSLKEVMLAGCAPSSQVEMERRFRVPACEIYGMTEIGGSLRMPASCRDMVGSGSVGLPMLFREHSVRDSEGAPVPVGTVGELWVRGHGLMAGYHRRPEANAEQFRGDWFRTGDLARADERGFHYITGRIKDMIRRSGENVSAREVEEAALLLPEVEDVAVVSVPDADRGEEIKLYLCLKPGLGRAGLPVERVLAHAREHLAPFKVPRYLAYVDSFPRTASNKIEKGTLRAAADPRADAFDAQDGVWR